MAVGCSRPNPGFVLATQGDEQTSSTSDSGLSGGMEGTAAGSSGAESGAADTTTGGVVAMTTSTGEGTGTTGTGEGTGTSDVMSTGAEASSSGETTGGGEQEVIVYDLWELCPAPSTKWNAVEGQELPLVCNVKPMPPPAPWAGQLLQGFEFEGVFQGKVLAEVPSPGVGNLVTGFYQQLVLNGASSPRLRSVLVCPGPGTCDIVGAIWVEVENVVKVSKVNINLSNGGYTMIDLDLELVNDGTPFDIGMEVKSKVDAPSSHGLWLRPRVITMP